MTRRTLSLVLLLVVSALPLSASQFIDLPFDQVARGAKYIVRGTVVDTFATWDDSREVIWTYATVRVQRYFGETAGPDTLVVRNVGGTVDGYTQEAVGFPVLRRGENVVLMLAEADGNLVLHAYNQGKLLVQRRGAIEVLVADPVKQGEARPQLAPHFGEAATNSIDDAPALTMDEFASMVDDARAGFRPAILRQQQ
jgi:hypothetical protein